MPWCSSFNSHRNGVRYLTIPYDYFASPFYVENCISALKRFDLDSSILEGKNSTNYAGHYFRNASALRKVSLSHESIDPAFLMSMPNFVSPRLHIALGGPRGVTLAKLQRLEVVIRALYLHCGNSTSAFPAQNFRAMTNLFRRSKYHILML